MIANREEVICQFGMEDDAVTCWAGSVTMAVRKSEMRKNLGYPLGRGLIQIRTQESGGRTAQCPCTASMEV